jgi:GAF domain-containing protein/HAMP domain-containing protein
LLDSQGQEEIRLSRLAIISADELGSRAGTDEFERPKASGETYYSSVQFSEEINEPFMTIAVPLFDSRSGEFTGVLVADFRFKAVWDLMVSAEAGGEGTVYVVSESDSKVIAHPNPSVVLRGTQFDSPAEDGFYPGLDGTDVAMAVERIKLGEQEFAIVAEKPAAEALELAINAVYITVIVMVISLVIAGVLGFVAARQIVRPIRSLATTAQAISAGDLSQQVEVTRGDEVGELAQAFNSMTIQLRGLIGTLEERIRERTQRLEIVATLSERLSAILDFDQLLTEMVDQVKESFDYYHAHVYILDDNRQNLVMTAGAGRAGAEMKARGHHIPLDAPTSLVARTARSGEIVRVDNVREAEDWLYNPLLPDTYAEMAVPIMLEGQVVGVLDVQEDEIAGLDEGDASLLRSLANQVAVAIRNAHLFAEVEEALARARAVQEQYLEQAWEKVKAVQQVVEYQYHRSGTPLLDETVIAQLEQEAMTQSQVAVVAVNGGDIAQKRTESDTSDAEIDYIQDSKSEIQKQTALVAPIRLQEQTIGTIQLLETEDQHQWDELELALVQAVADQVAQAAENLRLFDETRQRAGREQTLRQITEHMRSATNLDELVKIAAEELGQHLSAEYTLVELGLESKEERHADPN